MATRTCTQLFFSSLAIKQKVYCSWFVNAPALVAAHFGGPLSPLYVRDVEENGGLLGECIIGVDEKPKRAEHAPMSRPPLAAVEVLGRRLIHAVHVGLLKLNQNVQLRTQRHNETINEIVVLCCEAFADLPLTQSVDQITARLV
jgi:hypothetical protein